MDDRRFDDLIRAVGGMPSRRDALRAFVAAGLAAVVAGETTEDSEAGTRRRRACRGARKCDGRCCPKRTFCCDPKRETCCADGDECCNPGHGTGSCCTRPSRCGKPYGDDGGDRVCCPPKRQFLTTTGLVRCCPPGTQALEGVTAEAGPCCPEERFCGDTCCNEGTYCADRETKTCCGESQEICDTTDKGKVCCTKGSCCKLRDGKTYCCNRPQDGCPQCKVTCCDNPEVEGAGWCCSYLDSYADKICTTENTAAHCGWP